MMAFGSQMQELRLKHDRGGDSQGTVPVKKKDGTIISLYIYIYRVFGTRDFFWRLTRLQLDRVTVLAY